MLGNAKNMSTPEDESVIFNKLSFKFSQLLYGGRTKGDTSHINRILEEINKLDYRYPIITNGTKAVLLIHQCCSIIPPDDLQPIFKCCRLITNLVIHQHIKIEGQTLSLVTHWCLQALKHSDAITTVEILTTLKVLLNSNVHNARLLLAVIVSNNSSVITLAKDEGNLDAALLAVQCLEACTAPSDDPKNDSNTLPQLELTSDVFVKYLTKNSSDNAQYNKLLIYCLKGLQNVITHHSEFLKKELGLLLGIARSFMLYRIKGVNFQIPQKVSPSILNIPESSVNIPKEKKGGKVAKQRKPRTSKKKDVKKSDDDEDVRVFRGYVPTATNLNEQDESSTSWSRLTNGYKTSDSEFSDTEHGRVAKLGLTQDRVRQAALNYLLQIVKMTDKPTIFGYWSSFIPDGSSAGGNHLTVCILKDPSPKGRMAALHVLLTLITRSKLYLIQAESSKKYTAYTPFSVILGAMVTDLHKCLSLALNENCITVLLQVLKCLAALVQASPYHKLMPGMTRKIIRNVKIYNTHRDAAVQVTALIVMECILGSEPVVPETKQALLKQVNVPAHAICHKNKNDNSLDNDETDEYDMEYVDFSSDDEDDTDEDVYREVPWLLERCLNNLGVYFNESRTDNVVTAPVKVQSLQVISAMTRNYFDCLIVPFLSHIAKALDICLIDSYMDLRLHAGRTIDFIGQAMNQHLSTQDPIKLLRPEQGLGFWQVLINSSLTALLQCEQHSVLRAVGCDCLASIGSHIFEYFPRGKQILIITLLFPCSRDEDNSVRAAAVRALAISVLYPSLRDDPGFVVDVAEAIHRTLQDGCIIVRIKASWSLGNLSDALVLNKDDPSKEEIPDKLLLKLLQISIKVANDNDKIKVNAVRALGNLLQLVNTESIGQDTFKEAVNEALAALIKTCTSGTNMKVRWNSCYAIGNALKNSHFFINSHSLKDALIQALIKLVVDFSNFKVRINAALALSCINTRELYESYFYIIWDWLLKALENTQNIEDFSEYNHQGHLVEQICLTLGHLTTLLRIDDLLCINESTQLHFDLFKLQMHKVLDRLLPEKSSVLILAATHLTSMFNEKSLSIEQHEVLSNLLKIYVND